MLPLGLFVLSAALALWAYWITDFVAINPVELIQRYKNKTERELVQRFTATNSEHTMINYEFNQRKVRWIYAAFSSLILAIGLFLLIAFMNLM